MNAEETEAKLEEAGGSKAVDTIEVPRILTFLDEYAKLLPSADHKEKLMRCRWVLLLSFCLLASGPFLRGAGVWAQTDPSSDEGVKLDENSATKPTGTPPPETTERPTEDQKSNERVEYQLVRITIPPDSPLRKQTDIYNNPPNLYIVILENGLPIKTGWVKTSSEIAKGWEVEFPDTKRDIWKLSPEPKVTYTLQVWDSQWGRDAMILSITNLRMNDFNTPIMEKLGTNYPPECQTKIEFVKK